MYIQQGISVGNLLLDLTNYRHGTQTSQKDARDAIIADQGKKLVKLAEDIIEVGLNPFDLPMVIDAEDDHQNFIVVEGNRRLTAISLLLSPELAAGTPIHKSFARLSKKHADAIPKVLLCVIAPSKAAARVWIDRKHANGLEGAGTEHWTSIAKARADVDAGEKRPDLDVVNFLLSEPSLDTKLRSTLEGGAFNLSTLQRIVTTKELQSRAGFELKDGKLISTADKKWLHGVLTDVATTIANGVRNGDKFTERSIDTVEKREEFVSHLVNAHPAKKKLSSAWTVNGEPTKIPNKAKNTKSASTKGTLSTGDQPNLIPKRFRLVLPSGKINDVFIELKKLDVTTYRHAASVLFRVFIEFSLEHYIDKNSVSLPKDNKGHVDDRLATKLKHVVAHMRTNGVMTQKELKPVDAAISNIHSVLAANTLNAYVHSRWMNPEPLELKVAWANFELFIEKLWTQDKAGQNES
jgi:hypothetical protein